MNRAILVMSLAAAWAAPAGAAIPSTATLRGIDLYRSEQVTAQRLVQLFGPKVALYLERINAGDSGRRDTVKLKADIEDGVRKLGRFAFVSMHMSRNITASSFETTVTFDVVDAAQAAQRMPFYAPPRGRLPDPGGLLAGWRGYGALCADMRRRGEVAFERPNCPAFYCPWVPPTEATRKFESRFAAEVPAEQGALAAILSRDSDPAKREAAAYLLAYSTSAKTLSELMLKAMQDPDREVRAAALTVLADMAASGRGVFIEASRVMPALDYPTVSDRSKALAVLAALAARPEYKAYIISRASPQLVRLLRSLDPGLRDLAYTVLGMVSGKNYDRKDVAAWEAWAQSVSSGAPPK